MKSLKLLTTVMLAVYASLSFETKAAVPDGYSQMNTCVSFGGKRYYKLQKTDEPASYGVWNDSKGTWAAQYVSYDSATNTYKEKCL